MVAEWTELSFADAPLEIIDGDRGTNYPKLADFSSSGHCLFLNAGNVTVNGFDFSDCSFVDQEKDEALRKGKLQRDDIVLTTRGTVGNVALYDQSIPCEHIRLNSGMVILRADKEALLPRFLYLFLRSRNFKDQVVSLTTGSAQPQLPIRDMRRVELSLPPLYEQRAIAHILGTLDDKIELNRRMNQTLEAMARAIFKSWFVDFDPVRAKDDGRDPGVPSDLAAFFPDSFEDSEMGEIPKGWAVGPILNRAKLLSGGTPKTDREDYWDGDVLWVSAKDVSQCGETFLIATERTITGKGLKESATQIIPAFCTVVVARGATTGRMVLFGREMAMNQTCYGLASTIGTPFALHCLLQDKIDEFVHTAHGSVFDTITTSTFASSRVILAPKPLLEAFENVISPLFQRILINTEESRTLAALRDVLLPKLLSGEIRVKDTSREAVS